MRRMIRDIAPPDDPEFAKRPLERVVVREPSPGLTHIARAGMLLLALVLGVSGWYFAAVVDFAREAKGSAAAVREELGAAEQALRTFDVGKARLSFETIDGVLRALEARAGKDGLLALGDLWGAVTPTIKEAKNAFAGFREISGAMLRLAAHLELVRNKGFGMAMHGEGERLLSSLQEIKTAASTLAAKTRVLGSLDASVMPLPENKLAIQLALYKSEGFLDALLDFLSAPAPEHLLVLFQNPSEIRPSGGFLGSYADLVLERGNVRAIEVTDIYDPDGQLHERRIPPKPLQAITPDWEARDANWFFNFPSSAKKIIGFLERSKLYEERGITFPGAIAVNIHVLESLLEFLGPVELPNYGITITNENFLPQIQAEVEFGKDKAAGEPKRILKVLLPLLLERFKTLPEGRYGDLLARFASHIKEKDIMVFFANPALQSYMEEWGAAGNVFALPKRFIGDYLAVVNANIGGGKSDAVMRENISLRSAVGNDGVVENELVITRTHEGNRAKESFYRATNRNWLRVFTPLWSRFVSAEGFLSRTIDPPLDYEKEGYVLDPEVRAIEDTKKTHEAYAIEESQEEGKTVFAGWTAVRAGATGTFTLTYRTPQPIPLVSAPLEYIFIYEKQSGVPAALSYVIEAPPGYRWRENKLAAFTYQNERAPGRVMLTLTLEPVPELHEAP